MVVNKVYGIIKGRNGAVFVDMNIRDGVAAIQVGVAAVLALLSLLFSYLFLYIYIQFEINFHWLIM